MSDKPKSRAIYLKERYQNDSEYREWRKQYSKEYYKRKTVQCLDCKKRYKFQELEMSMYEYNIKDFHCHACTHPENVTYIKSSRGRPQKGVLEYNGSE